MDGMLEVGGGFYNNLFSIGVAAFGVTLASIFVFLQIALSQVSYREIKIIVKNAHLTAYLLVSTFLLFISGLARSHFKTLD